MLHVFSINLVKLATRKSKTTIILGRREYTYAGFMAGTKSLVFESRD
jgi:hypothetical protein